MLHARQDYNRIQDPDNKIPKDEPVFLLRGQDISAPSTLRHWADQNELNCGEVELSIKARKHALAMEKWQLEHHVQPADE